MQKHILLPGLAVICGGIGATLRRWALSAAFEADTGLPIASHPAMLALIAFSGAAVLLLALLCRGCPSTLEDAAYHKAFYAPEASLLAVGQAAGIVLGLSALLTATEIYPLFLSRLSELETLQHNDSNWLRALLHTAPELAQTLLGLAAAICLFFTARGLAMAEASGRFRARALIPAFYTCFWLINIYRQQATDPIVLAYAWHLFAILSVVLAMYYAAGFSFQNVRPRLTVYFSLLGVFFSLTTMPDTHTLAELLTLAAFLLWLLCASISLLRNLTGSPHIVPGRRPSPRPTLADDEDDDVDIVL